MANTVGSSVLASMPPDERRRNLLKAVVASTVGTSIEWYDYFLFGTAGALVFAKLFFPKSDQLAGTLNVYVIFFVVLLQGVGMALPVVIVQVGSTMSKSPGAAPSIAP